MLCRDYCCFVADAFKASFFFQLMFIIASVSLILQKALGILPVYFTVLWCSLFAPVSLMLLRLLGILLVYWMYF